MSATTRQPRNPVERSATSLRWPRPSSLGWFAVGSSAGLLCMTVVDLGLQGAITMLREPIAAIGYCLLFAVLGIATTSICKFIRSFLLPAYTPTAIARFTAGFVLVTTLLGTPMLLVRVTDLDRIGIVYYVMPVQLALSTVLSVASESSLSPMRPPAQKGPPCGSDESFHDHEA